MSWVVVPCLLTLRSEFNKVAPNRDKGADGTVGDTSHSASSSDHNPDETGNTPYEDADYTDEVHALDIDSTGKWPDGKGGEEGAWFDKKIRYLAAKERAEYNSATVYGRLQNIIWRGQIISRSWGWSEWRTYTGSNKHFDHAHFSARYTTAQENDTRPWGVYEEDDMTKAEFLDWMDEWATSVPGREAIARAVLTYDPGKNPDGSIKPGGIPNPGDDAATNPTIGAAWALNRAAVASILGYQNRDRIDALSALMKAAIADEASRDAQEHARDVALKTVLDTVAKAVQQPGQVAMTEAQFATLQQTIAEKVAEVGQDVADATASKLNQVAEALDNAGAALSTANDPQPQ